jgi:hypothetical protein
VEVEVDAKERRLAKGKGKQSRPEAAKKIGGEANSDKENGDEDTVGDGRSLALISSGCSASSITIEFTKQLIMAHGVAVQGGAYEIMKPETNRFWDSALEKLKSGSRRYLKRLGDMGSDELASKDHPYQDVIIEAMNQSIADAASKDNKLLFKVGANMMLGRKRTEKWGDGNIGSNKVPQGLIDLGVSFRHHYRENVLDVMVCAVRDCFAGGSRMYPVYANNGTKVEGLCMDRRKAKVKVKAQFDDPSHLIKKMRKKKELIDAEVGLVDSIPGVGEAYKTEDLFAFEYTDDEEVFESSLKEWMSFISSTVDPDEAIVAKFLRKYQGKLTMKPHSETIYNIDEVAEALKNADPPLDHYLRL